MSLKEIFCELIQNKTATIGIIGLGYVGLPLVLRFSALGYRVIGIDIDGAKVQKLNSGASYIQHISSASILGATKNGFKASTDFAETTLCDALIICVPTPLNKYREPDISFITDTVDTLLPLLRAGQVLSLESTTYPGTTDEELLPRLQSTGLEVGKEIFLVYSPEREDPGNSSYETSTIPKVIGGHTTECLEAGISLYSPAINKLVPVSSTKVAEMAKLLENIQRAVNIGLVNEMKLVADRMGIDIFEVVDAAATKPFGFTAYYPGPGLGGHCIPVDPFYLTWKAREYGIHTRFIELAGEVNQAMPGYVVGKLIEGLNNQGKSLKDKRILVLGIAYKKNVDDVRESPSVQIMELINDRGAIVAYSDPHVPIFPKMRDHRFDLVSEDLSANNLASFDAVVLCTDHCSLNYEHIKKHSQLIVDSRGIYRDTSAQNIIKA